MKNMKIRDTKKRTDNRRIREGDYAKPGVTIQGEWTTFTFDAEKEDSCFVVLKDIQTEKEEKIAVPAEYCMGSVRSIAVADLHLEHLIYDFEINGKKVMDPCAHAIMGRQVWNDSSRSLQQYEVHGAFDVQEFDWGEDVTDDYVQAACAWFYDGFRYQKCSGDISCAYEPDSLSEETRCDNS